MSRAGWKSHLTLSGSFLLAALGAFAAGVKGLDKVAQTSELAALTSMQLSQLTVVVATNKQEVCDLKENLNLMQSDIREIRADVKTLLRRHA